MIMVRYGRLSECPWRFVLDIRIRRNGWFYAQIGRWFITRRYA